jgi:uncharacterized protein YggE
MKRLAFPAAFLVLLVLSLAFAACGDDDDKSTPSDTNEPEVSQEETEANITTQKGLTVSARNAGFGSSGGGSGGGLSADALVRPGTGGAGAAMPASAGDSASGFYSGDQSSSNSANAQVGEGGGGLTVTGYGTATAPADSAILEFYFNTNNYSCGSPGASPSANRITEETLQPVADALIAVGVAAEDIEFVGQGYWDACYQSGSVRAIARDVANAENVATAVTDASRNIGNGITLSSTNVSYTLEDCSAIEAAATRTAAEDAADNVERLADALGLNVGSITAASDYSYPWYYPYFGTETCGSSYYGPMPFYTAGDLADAPKEVQVFANINVTYDIQ